MEMIYFGDHDQIASLATRAVVLHSGLFVFLMQKWLGRGESYDVP